MHPDYEDITSRILTEPLWYYRQDAAIPRYEPFRPELCGIYDEWAALTVIRCQACRREFLASVSFSPLDRFERSPFKEPEFVKVRPPTAEDAGWFDMWGDPPRHDCVGDTMTSELVRIAEFWVKVTGGAPWKEWARSPEYEFDYSHLL